MMHGMSKCCITKLHRRRCSWRFFRCRNLRLWLFSVAETSAADSSPSAETAGSDAAAAKSSPLTPMDACYRQMTSRKREMERVAFYYTVTRQRLAAAKRRGAVVELRFRPSDWPADRPTDRRSHRSGAKRYNSSSSLACYNCAILFLLRKSSAL